MEKYITSKEAAEFLCYSENTLRHSRMTNKLGGSEAPNHYKMGRNKVLYKVSELDAWVKNHTDNEAV